jgi:hypothetical protein
MRLIKSAILVLLLASAMVFAASFAQAGPLSLNFSSLAGSTIQFNGVGSSFSLNPVGGPQWSITSVSGGTGDALQLQGMFSGGPWLYGPITVNGPVESATVISPSGSFTIYDGSGGSATGTVNWVEVSTFASLGGINSNALVNISGMTYLPGSTPVVDLQNLVLSGAGSVNVTFQFNPGMKLSQLTSGTGPYQTSFSGSLSPAAVPEPSFVLLLGTGLGLACMAGWRFRN